MTKETIQGIKQGLGVSLYCGLIGTVMQNGSKLFGQKDNFITPIFALTLFCVSALICLLIVFKKPYELFFEGKKKEAVNIVIYTAVCLFILLIILFSIMVLLNNG